ncbi:MAG: flagellar hook-basal body complex protein, partial [Eubacterium sp.]|nr:flagellar hook-basal body complex protein [Eubacterium sp.]
GNLTYPDATGNQQNMGVQIGLAYFPNAGGLTKASESNYLESGASGVPTTYSADQLGSVIKSGYLEASNVQAADEMVNMIIAQRAYEMNSKAITASDEMLQQANNLRS